MNTLDTGHEAEFASSTVSLIYLTTLVKGGINSTLTV
jgi:hypothetical protein